MPPMRTSSLSEPSCSMALVKRSVTWPCSVSSNPRRDRLKFSAVKTKTPAANRPATSVKSRPRAASRAVCSSADLAGPTS